MWFCPTNILLTLLYGVSRFAMASDMHLCSNASQKRVYTLSGINRDIIGMFHGTQYPHVSTAKWSLFSKSQASFEYLWKTCIPSISSDNLHFLLFKSISLGVTKSKISKWWVSATKLWSPTSSRSEPSRARIAVWPV